MGFSTQTAKCTTWVAPSNRHALTTVGRSSATLCYRGMLNMLSYTATGKCTIWAHSPARLPAQLRVLLSEVRLWEYPAVVHFAIRTGRCTTSTPYGFPVLVGPFKTPMTK